MGNINDDLVEELLEMLVLALKQKWYEKIL